MKSKFWAAVAIVGIATTVLGGAAFALRVPHRVKNRLKSIISNYQGSNAPSEPELRLDLPPVQRSFSVQQAVYSGGLKNDWEDYGWADRNITGPGPAELNLSNYGGWILHHKQLPGSDWGALAFRIKYPSNYGNFLEVRLVSDVASLEPITVNSRYQFSEANGWILVVVPWYELNPFKQPFNGIRFYAKRPVSNGKVLVDQIALTSPQGGPEPKREFPNRSETVTIHCDRPVARISPLIYGVAGRKITSDLGATSYRFGGNPTSRFNWSLGNVWNTSQDWFFRNVDIEWDWKSLVELSVQNNAEVTLTLPMLGWVAKDASSYSFPVAVFGEQEKVEPGRPDVGNGVDKGGKPIQPGPPERTSVPASPDLVAQWVTSIQSESARRGRTVHSYILDNEPGLWNSTHRDVHPEPVGYDELLERTIRYGTAVRKADPDAIIAGPAEWGWSNYFWSAKDAEAGHFRKPDRRAHGDVPLLDWYLRQLYEYEKKTGIRVLDVVDLHFYPQGNGIFNTGGEGATDLNTAIRRIRSTRSLWDRDYEDESWIKERIYLVPRLKEIIHLNYPGRRISIGEWNFGAETHISGGLATAEVLGRFAETGVYSAYYWTTPRVGSPAYWGFRAYRNFDGKGSRFLDQFVSATPPKDVSVFASRNDSASHYVIVVLVLTNTHSINVKFDTKTCGNVTQWKSYRYDGDPKGFSLSKSANIETISDTLSPFSIAVFDFEVTRNP